MQQSPANRSRALKWLAPSRRNRSSASSNRPQHPHDVHAAKPQALPGHPSRLEASKIFHTLILGSARSSASSSISSKLPSKKSSSADPHQRLQLDLENLNSASAISKLLSKLNSLIQSLSQYIRTSLLGFPARLGPRTSKF